MAVHRPPRRSSAALPPREPQREHCEPDGRGRGEGGACRASGRLRWRKRIQPEHARINPRGVGARQPLAVDAILERAAAQHELSGLTPPAERRANELPRVLRCADRARLREARASFDELAHFGVPRGGRERARGRRVRKVGQNGGRCHMHHLRATRVGSTPRPRPPASRRGLPTTPALQAARAPCEARCTWPRRPPCLHSIHRRMA